MGLKWSSVSREIIAASTILTAPRERITKPSPPDQIDAIAFEPWLGIGFIPDAILLKIFSYLNTQDRVRASLACTQWHRVCIDASLWQHLDFSAKSVPKKAKIRDKNIIMLISRYRFCNLEHIDLSGACSKTITNFTLFYIAQNCTRLRRLNVSCCRKITDTGFEMLARNCLAIEELHMGKCTAITAAGIILAVRKLRGLKCLNICESDWVSDLVLIHIARFSKQLNYLNIEGCKKITDTGIQVLVGIRRSLRHVNLRNTKRITNEGLANFLSKTPKLEGIELSFTRKSRANISVLESVSEHCKNLKYFDIQDCKAMSIDDVMIQIANHNPGLRYIAVRQQLRALANDTVRTITKQCPDLSKVETDMRG